MYARVGLKCNKCQAYQRAVVNFNLMSTQWHKTNEKKRNTHTFTLVLVHMEDEVNKQTTHGSKNIKVKSIAAADHAN